MAAPQNAEDTALRSPGRRHRRCGASRIAVASLVAGLVVVWVSAIPGPAVHAQSADDDGLGTGAVGLGFTSTTFELRPAMYWRNSMAPEGERLPSPRTIIPSASAFARVQIESDDSSAPSVTFKVEDQPDRSRYGFCDGLTDATRCQDVLVGVTNGTRPGLLYLYTSDRYRKRERISPLVADFPAQPVELSADDMTTPLKVYREILVTPSSVWSSKDCSDFPDENEERFTCLFLREIRQNDTPATTSSMRSALPDLVQADKEYDLVFAEEFSDSTPNPDHACASGLSALDANVWDMGLNCATDANDTMCIDVVDGHLVQTHSAHCGFGMTSNGGFSFKYGYVEIKYTFTFHPQTKYTNYNFLVGGEQYQKHSLSRYGVTIDSDEAAGKFLGSVINVFEYGPTDRYQLQHTNLNHLLLGTGTRDSSISRFTSRRIGFCVPARDYFDEDVIEIALSHSCTAGEQVTVVRGVEWTPRGYRDFLKVEGVHNDLSVMQPASIVLYERARRWRLGVSVQSILSGTDRDQYFEQLVSGSTNSALVNYAVGHAPLYLNTGAWGDADHKVIGSSFKTDYIRVFQPNNLYRDMEPVYN